MPVVFTTLSNGTILQALNLRILAPVLAERAEKRKPSIDTDTTVDRWFYFFNGNECLLFSKQV